MDVTALKRTRKFGWMISPVETRQIGFLFISFSWLLSREDLQGFTRSVRSYLDKSIGVDLLLVGL